MNESEERSETEGPQDEPIKAREPVRLTADAMRARVRQVRLKVEPFEFEMDGDLFVVDAHEVSGGERVSLLEKARKLHEGKLDGGTPRFYREMIARVFHVPGTTDRVWDAKKDAELIDMLPTEVHEALMKKALGLNGMDPDSVKNAKNGSATDA